MEPVAVREHRVDERLTHVDPAAARLEHALDELADLSSREHCRRELVASAACDEDLGGLVDPDLLHLGIVQIRLEGTEAGDPRDNLGDHAARLLDAGDLPGEAPLVMEPDGLLGQPAYGAGLVLRIDPLRADPLAHTLIDLLDERTVGADVGARRRGRSSAVLGRSRDHHV